MSDAPKLRLYLWPTRVVYLGVSPDNELHRHHAAQICVSLDGILQIQDGRERLLEAPGVVVPPDRPHRIGAGDARILALYLEPESAEYPALMRPWLTADGSDRIHSLDPSRKRLASLRALSMIGGDPDKTWSTCITALGLGSSAAPSTDRDGRVERVIDIIRGEPGATHPLERLADAVHLSPSRLTHLFREQVGVPIRRFTVWTRMRQVVQFSVEGATLTDAAHAAGFSDAAHMSNTFRKMFGFAPSALFTSGIRKAVTIVN